MRRSNQALPTKIAGQASSLCRGNDLLSSDGTILSLEETNYPLMVRQAHHTAGMTKML